MKTINTGTFKAFMSSCFFLSLSLLDTISIPEENLLFKLNPPYVCMDMSMLHESWHKYDIQTSHYKLPKWTKEFSYELHSEENHVSESDFLITCRIKWSTSLIPKENRNGTQFTA